jgi:hypothetical protein
MPMAGIFDCGAMTPDAISSLSLIALKRNHTFGSY